MKQQLLFLFLIFSFSLFGQSPEKYSKISIVLEADKTIQQLAELGIDVEHGKHVPGRYLKNIFSEREIERITTAGFQIKTEVEDWQAYFLNKKIKSRIVDCPEPISKLKKYPIPHNFKLGSMAGYFTYREMLDNLDSMAAKYPTLITPREETDTFKTHEGHPIYWTRISKNASAEENEPKAFYTALHHAREPMSLSQLIFFMWYLLENYGTDQEVTYLLDHTELYFVPCINPDGYLFNEWTNPDGGGLWRKNRRNNTDGEWGVDLNRNYGWEWGFDDAGSSPSTASDTYRGTEGFSEPETRAIKFLCEKYDFELAMNYHSHGDLLIYPWGYSDTPSEDSITFRTFAEAMARYNDYFAGTGTETVGYTVNGDSDDWMYGAEDVFAMTPEVGSDFWTDEEEIWENCHAALWMNLAVANMPHEFGWAKDLSRLTIGKTTGYIPFEYSQAGMTASEMTVSLSGLSPEILAVGDTVIYNLNLNEKSIDSISFNLDSDIPDGTELQFLLTVSSPFVSWSDTLKKIFVEPRVPAFTDPADNLGNWFAGNAVWNVDSEYYYSFPTSFGDSPGEDYKRNKNESLMLRDPIDLSDAKDAKLNFWARWDIEADFDYAQISASLDGRTFTPLCGRYTRSGTENQDEGEPLWDGQQLSWVEEEVNLEDYLGEEEVFIRFGFVSDQFVSGAGFNFDDFSLIVKSLSSSTTLTLEESDFLNLKVHPNPSSDNFVVEIIQKDYEPKEGDVFIFNSLGKKIGIYSLRDLPGKQHLIISTDSWDTGIYFLQVVAEGEPIESKRLVFIR